MKKESLGALIALNIALLVALLLVFVLPVGEVQGQARRGRGDYSMIAGEVVGRENQSAIYIAELKSFQLAAIMFDSRANRIDLIGVRNMAKDLGD